MTEIQLIELTVNGQHRALQVAADRSLLDVLRHELGLKATRLGCGLGQCGACTVMVDGQAVFSCVTPVLLMQGREVTTLEGLGTAEAPLPADLVALHRRARRQLSTLLVEPRPPTSLSAIDPMNAQVAGL